MPTLTVGAQSAEVPADKRLVLAIEDLGIHIGHRCGGNARCTTCRVTFAAGEPDTMTVAEFTRLKAAGLYGTYRLSCQITCSHDMAVTPAMTLETQGWSDTGPTPDPQVRPDPAAFPIAELEAR